MNYDSRKGPKHVLSEVEGGAKEEEKNQPFAVLASWRDQKERERDREIREQAHV